MSADTPSRKLATFGLLFALCLGLRVGLIVGRDVPGELERRHGARFGYEMNRAALAVMRAGSIRDVFADGSGPSAHVSPAYPYLLGGVYRLVGPDPRRMRLAQCLLSATFASLAIALLPAVVRSAGLRPGAGTLAALTMASNMLNLGLETHGEWEQPLAALTLVLVVLDAGARRREGWRSIAGTIRSGALLGWSALLSPPIALAAGLIPIGEAMIRPDDRRRIARDLAIQGVVLVVALAPWAVRNYRELGGAVPLRSNFGLEASLVYRDGASGYFDDDAMRRHPYSSEPERVEYRRVGELAYMKAKMRTARDWAAEHPLRCAGRFARQIFLFWFDPIPPGIRLEDASIDRLFRLSVGQITAINLLAIFGLFGLFRRRHPSRAVFAAAMFGPSLIYGLVQVSARYGHPTRPIAALLAMDLIVGAVARARRRAEAPAPA